MLGFLLTPWMKQWVIPAGGHCIGATEAWRLYDRFCWETQPQMMKNMTTSSTAPTSKLDQTPLKSMKKTSKKLIYSEWSALAPDYIGFFFGWYPKVGSRTERDPELRVKIVESTRDFADDPVVPGPGRGQANTWQQVFFWGYEVLHGSEGRDPVQHANEQKQMLSCSGIIVVGYIYNI